MQKENELVIDFLPAFPRRDAWENPSEVGDGKIVCTWLGWLEVAELVGEVA
jgi:hypothetical protein